MSSRATGLLTLEERLRACFRVECLYVSSRKVAKHANVYTCGDHDRSVYLVETGQIKILVLSPDGKECLLSIYRAGDIFGELCLAGGNRPETATAMKDSVLRQMPCSNFLSRLTRDGLLEDFIKYLALRLEEQQQLTTHLVTGNSEQRLAATLLQLARKLGKRDPRSLRIEERISHQELSKMVGTTRSRIGQFMQRFCELGFIEKADRSLVINEGPLAQYLETGVQVRAEKKSRKMLNSEQAKCRRAGRITPTTSQ